MKACIFEIKRFAVHDGDGIRTTIFFKGCPLKCVWCHNPEGLSLKPQLAYNFDKCISCGECTSVCPTGAHTISGKTHIYDRKKCVACGACEKVCLGNALNLYGKEYTVKQLLEIVLKDNDYYKNTGGGVTLSGGECLLYADFCAELLKEIKQNGVNTAVDTCGYVPQNTLDKVIPFTDVFLYDIKAFSPYVHKKCTMQSNARILKNLFYLDKKGCKIEIRIPYVPDYNDMELAAIGKTLSKLKHLTKVRLLSYHNFAGSKYASLQIKNTLPPRTPTESELSLALKTLKSFGLNVVK